MPNRNQRVVVDRSSATSDLTSNVRESIIRQFNKIRAVQRHGRLKNTNNK